MKTWILDHVGQAIYSNAAFKLWCIHTCISSYLAGHVLAFAHRWGNLAFIVLFHLLALSSIQSEEYCSAWHNLVDESNCLYWKALQFSAFNDSCDLPWQTFPNWAGKIAIFCSQAISLPLLERGGWCLGCLSVCLSRTWILMPRWSNSHKTSPSSNSVQVHTLFASEILSSPIPPSVFFLTLLSPSPPHASNQAPLRQLMWIHRMPIHAVHRRAHSVCGQGAFCSTCFLWICSFILTLAKFNEH